MLTYENLRRVPVMFPAFVGMTHAEFVDFLPRFVSAEEKARQESEQTTDGQPRQRAVGGGRRPKNSAADRLLMALVWLRIYPTYEVLGFFFSLHKRNAQLGVLAVLAVLEPMSDFRWERPTSDHARDRSPEAIMAAFPEISVIVDAKEQRINKPEGEEKQKPYYSGKKKPIR